MKYFEKIKDFDEKSGSALVNLIKKKNEKCFCRNVMVASNLAVIKEVNEYIS